MTTTNPKQSVWEEFDEKFPKLWHSWLFSGQEDGTANAATKEVKDFIRARFIPKDELEKVLDYCESDPPADSVDKTEGFHMAFDDIRARLALINQP